MTQARDLIDFLRLAKFVPTVYQNQQHNCVAIHIEPTRGPWEFEFIARMFRVIQTETCELSYNELLDIVEHTQITLTAECTVMFFPTVPCSAIDFTDFSVVHGQLTPGGYLKKADGEVDSEFELHEFDE